MKKILITTLTLFAMAVAGTVSAQSHKLTDAWFALKNNDLSRAKQSVDEAYEHETTRGTAKMYYYRGLVYMQICANAQEDEAIRKLDPEASYKSAESFYQYLISSEKKKKSELAEVHENILYAGNFCLIDAEGFYNKEQYKEAIKYSEMVYNLTLHDEKQKLKQNGITTNKILMSMYYYASELKDKTLTRKYLDMLIENKYEDPKLYIYLSESYFEEGDSVKGIDALEKGRQVYPEDKDLLIAEINYYLDRGQTEQLLKRFDEAIEAEPENASYHFFRGTLYHQRQVYGFAERDYKKAIEINPDYIDAMYNLGAMYVEQAAPIVDRMNANAANFSLYDQLERDKFALYEKALPYLAEAYESGEVKEVKDQENLLLILRDTYKFKKDRDKMVHYQNELDKVRSGQ